MVFHPCNHLASKLALQPIKDGVADPLENHPWSRASAPMSGSQSILRTVLPLPVTHKVSDPKLNLRV